MDDVIKVVAINAAIDIDAVTFREREFIFENLKTAGVLDANSARAHLELRENIIWSAALLAKPELPELWTRTIVELGAALVQGGCIEVVIPELLVRRVFGETEVSASGRLVRFARPIECITLAGIKRVVGVDEEIVVLGLRMRNVHTGCLMFTAGEITAPETTWSMLAGVYKARARGLERLSYRGLHPHITGVKLQKQPAWKPDEQTAQIMSALGVKALSAEDLATRLDEKNMTDTAVVAMCNGIEHISGMMESRNTREQAVRQAAANRRKNNDVRAETNLYRRLVEAKFGDVVANALDANLALAVPRPTGVSILKLLTADQRKVIMTYHDSLVEAYNAAGRCEHSKAVKLYFRAKSDVNRANALKTVMGYATPRKHDGFITCKLCNGNLICGHVVAMANAPGRERAALNKYAAGQFCSVCSARLFDEFEVDVEQDTADDELRLFMFGEILPVVRRLNYVALININRLIGLCIQNIYDYIFELEKQLLANKTNTTEDIRNKKILFTAIYAYAYIVAVIVDTPRAERIFDVQAGGRTTADYIRWAVETIIATRNSTIANISGVNGDFVKNKVIDAYKILSRGRKHTLARDDKSDSLIDLMIDPRYHSYLLTYNIANGKQLSDESGVKAVTGVDAGELSGLSDGVYAGWKLPHDTKEIADSRVVFGGVRATTVFGGGPSRRPVRDTSTDIWTAAYPGYRAACFDIFEDYYRNGVFNLTTVADDKVAEEFLDVDASFNVAEKSLLRIRALQNLNPTQLPAISASREFKYVAQPLGAIWDEEGRRHTWAGNTCVVCGVSAEEVSRLDDVKIRRALDEKTNIIAYTAYYLNRCPAGNWITHKWHDDTCELCGMKYGKADADIVAKYAAKFAADKTVETVTVATTRVNRTIETPPPHTFNYGVIVKLCGLIKCNVHAFMALGATESINYIDITAGKYIPAEPDTHLNQRSYALDSALVTAVGQYNKLRHYNSLIKPEAWLRGIVESSDVKKFQYNQLAGSLDEHFVSHDTLIWYRKNKKPRELIAFQLETLAQLFLSIIEQPNTTVNTAALRMSFVKAVVGRLLKADEMLTAHGHINWSLFREEKAAEITNDIAGDVDEEDDDAVDTDSENEFADNLDVDGDPEDNAVRFEDSGVSGVE